MPAARIVWWKPRLLITVATTVSSLSEPCSCSASAHTARIASPSTISPSAVTARHRSASPSWAIPASAPSRRTASMSGPRWVELLVSHFTGDELVHLQDLVHRDGTVVTSRTTPAVFPKVPADVPVDVLTSARTFSGGEELAYDLQALGRARVVGETTGGGAHPRDAFDLTPHLQLHVPIARSVNAVTGTNWEGVGVVPDLACPAEEALSRAVGAS